MRSSRLTESYVALHAAQQSLKSLDDEYNANRTAIRERIFKIRQSINESVSGLDSDQIALAETVLRVHGSYASAGEDRASALHDAIKELSLHGGGKLWEQHFSTKNYDRWHGQRSDHGYGYGPKHGSLIFSIGLLDETRNRDPQALTPEEVEAAVYYLTHLSRIQDAKQQAAPSGAEA